MIPIVTPDEMAAVDAAAPEPVDVLIERAGAALAVHVRSLLGGTYGRRVVVVAGPGNNGADGRVAARRLARWGVHVTVVDAVGAPATLPDADLVVDAAFGTGLSRPYSPPATDAPVVAVDIVSGVSGLTGERLGEPNSAIATITFQALKPGLVLGAGADLSGDIAVVDLGLDVSAARAHLVEAADVDAWLPRRAADSHKWKAACWIIAGSEAMTGAATLAASAAARAGSGYVRLSVPGVTGVGPIETVSHPLPQKGWGGLLEGIERFGSLVIGPGLGRSPWAASCVREVLRNCPIPVVVDGDGLNAVAGDLATLGDCVTMPVLTPHDGEYETLTGRRPGPDRFAAARDLAAEAGAVVLLKGPATVVAHPDGDVLVSTSGDQRLATAGSGDVLSGIIGALLAQGLDPFHAAAVGAWVHGRAAEVAPRHGMVASDLLTTLPEVLDATHLG